MVTGERLDPDHHRSILITIAMILIAPCVVILIVLLGINKLIREVTKWRSRKTS